MSREYNIVANGVTVANNSPVTLAFFQAMAVVPFSAIEVVRVEVSQAGSTTSAMIRAALATQVSSYPTLTSSTPQPSKAGDPASKLTGGTAGAAGTAGINASAEGAGAKTVLVASAFNNLNGYLWVPTPRETIIETGQATAHGFGVNLPTAPSSLTLWNCILTFSELG